MFEYANESKSEEILDQVNEYCSSQDQSINLPYEPVGLFSHEESIVDLFEEQKSLKIQNHPLIPDGILSNSEENPSSQNLDFDSEDDKEEDSKEEVNHPSTSPDSESASEGKYKNGRGRPKDQMERDLEKIIQKIKAYIVKMFLEIENSKEDKSASRKRDDKPRTKIIRHIKKLPLVILKTVVSVGDYKHADEKRLFEAYRVAFECFTNILKCLNHDAISTSEITTDTLIEQVLEFASIHFPTTKVKKLSLVFLCSDDKKQSFIKSLCNLKDSCSIKKLKEQINMNRFISDLFKITKLLIEEERNFPNTSRVFDALYQELQDSQ